MRRIARFGLKGALCASLAACGSSGSPAANTTAAASGSGSTNAARLVGARVAAAECMRGQGLDIPDPTAQRASVLHMLSVLASYPPVKVQSAEKACMSEIRKAFPNATSLTPAQRSQRLQEAQAFASCMRSHGIDYPDPSAYAGNPSGYLRALSSINVNSPAFKTTGTTCKAVALKDAGG